MRAEGKAVRYASWRVGVFCTGMTPSFTSESVNFADCTENAISHAEMTPIPPPNVFPPTNPTTGLREMEVPAGSACEKRNTDVVELSKRQKATGASSESRARVCVRACVRACECACACACERVKVWCERACVRACVVQIIQPTYFGK